MRYAIAFSIVAVISANALAQDSPAAAAPASKSSRDAAIRSALASDNGKITAMEAAQRDGGGVFIGYSSGTVVNCFGNSGCRAFDGTPSSAVVGAVGDLSVSRSAGADIVWVAYPHGVVYRCSDYFCREFDASAGGAE
jgi:hypothetical protein